MAKRRTKKDKVSAQHDYFYKWHEAEVVPGSLPYKEGVTAKTQAGEVLIPGVRLFGYDPRLIRQDILKTMLVSSVIIAIELALYWYWYWR